MIKQDHKYLSSSTCPFHEVGDSGRDSVDIQFHLFFLKEYDYFIDN